MLPVNYRSWQHSFSELPESYQQWELTFLSTVAFWATKIPTTLRADVPVAIRATKNLEDTILPVYYRSWQRSFSKLPKPCQQWELIFLSTAIFRATKIPTTLRVDAPVAIRATKNLEETMVPVNYQSNYHSWQRSFSKQPKSCQQWELTFLSTVAFRATKIRTTLRADVPVAIRDTKKLEDTILPINYRSWQSSFSELPKTCQQWELTFLSIVAF